MTAKPRYTAEAFYYTNETEPAYFFVWDTKNSCEPRDGRRFATREQAQADADRRNGGKQ